MDRRAADLTRTVSVAASEPHHATREPRREVGDASTASAPPGDPVAPRTDAIEAVRLDQRGDTTVTPASSTRAVLRRATARRERVPLEPRHSEA